MEIYVLASGSKGNSTFIKAENTNILVDPGISYTKIKKKFNDYGLSINQISNVIITHEHIDHTYGLKTLLKYGNVKKIFLSKGTYEKINDCVGLDKVEIVFIKADNPFKIESINVYPLMAFHDALEPLNFKFEENNKSVVLITDTGYVHTEYHDLIANANLYILESNHCPRLLMNSSRPFMLKRRILGQEGHLSNDDASILMNKLIQSKSAKWVVAHISEDCNTRQDIEKAIVNNFDDSSKIEVFFTSQDSLDVIKI